MARPRSSPVVGHLLLAAACAAAMQVELIVGDKGEPGVLASAAIVLFSMLVVVQWRRPTTAFVLAMLGLFVLPAGIYNSMVAVPVICAYTVASRLGRGAAIAAGAFAMPLTLAILHFLSPHALLGWDTARNLALVVLPLALGVAAHERRAHTAALLERVEAAERSREEEARRRVDEERMRILRDVHDVIAHAMVGINVQAGVGSHLIERDPEEARAMLRNIKQASGDALVDLRSMLGVLRDDEETTAVPTAPVQSLVDLEALGERLGAAGVDLTLDLDSAGRMLPASVDATGYRIVQEALTNVIRHAGPTTATVRVERTAGGVVIDVLDDGGESSALLRDSGSGNGLRGMRERAAALGGTLQAGPRTNGGWRVTAVLPVPEEATT